MSTWLVIVVAISTAATVIVLSLMLSSLARAVIDSATERAAPDLSRLRGVLTRRSRGARRTVLRVIENAARPKRGEPAQALPVTPHLHAQRSVDVNESGRTGFGQGGRPDEDESAPYRQVGEKVTAVLTAAEHAAAQIRADADSYSEEARAAADAYAEETRRKADEDSARRVSQAEEQASLVRAQAEQKASEIEAEALRRHNALTMTNEGMQERIESMLAAFRRAASELEELLPAEGRSGAEEHERLDEALKPASSHRELSSHAGR